VLAGKHVALDFSKRDVALRKASVGMKNGVVGILPALVGDALLGGTPILDKSITIGIAGAIAIVMALLLDAVLLLIQRAATPWRRAEALA